MIISVKLENCPFVLVDQFLEKELNISPLSMCPENRVMFLLLFGSSPLLLTKLSEIQWLYFIFPGLDALGCMKLAAAKCRISG